ncbi:MAG: hypothetical protein ACXVHK_27700 [Solirubrobacteraceae bacterium]
MTDADLARLRASLDLVTYISPKPGVFAASPGLVRLDSWSGLFLEPGAGEDEWVLEARTWGNPPDSLVHEWHVRAALAARELDPTVPLPPREIAPTPEAATVPASNKRLARLVRRLRHLE